MMEVKDERVWNKFYIEDLSNETECQSDMELKRMEVFKIQRYHFKQ